MDNLEEDLTCCICYAIFEDPRVLPCSHTFCRGCLENVLHVADSYSIWRPLRVPLKCPNCRTVVELPPSGIESLPVNFSLRAIIEKYQKEDHPKTSTCPEHPRQPLNVFCILDQKLVCGCCLTIGKHQGHPIDDLESAYIKEKETPGKLLKQLTDKKWAHVCVLIEMLEHQKDQHKQVVQKDIEAVEEYFADLNKSLLQKKESMINALNEMSGKIAKEYAPLIEKIKSVREEQLDLISFSASVEEEESPLCFLEKVNIYRRRVEALKRMQLPQIRPLEICPSLEEFLKDSWSKIAIGQMDKAPLPDVNYLKRLQCSLNVSQNRAQTFKSPGQCASPFVIVLFLLILIFAVGIFFNKNIAPLTLFNNASYIIFHFLEVIQKYICESCSKLHLAKTHLFHMFHWLEDCCQKYFYA
ncbi:tripartite motif-containing protein 59 [Protopterus annectens]|uniref:tripartite motif-containing protein 59 n=1 Tax=Protopterus annectens TaxID=7888 RepID=UPI001CFBEA76|nr:tripartite motif-containing protein 59 [Protopterus annectens]XP_043926395.1 tripartite motif-containing protein 59 [Protopterus annectens]